MRTERIILIVLGVIALVVVTAGASAYVARGGLAPDDVKPVKAADTTTHHTVTREKVVYRQQPQQPVQQVKNCDDGNIVGTGIGAVAGGLVGHQFGGGKGKDLATIGGAIAGGAAGHEMIPTRNTLCR